MIKSTHSPYIITVIFIMVMLAISARVQGTPSVSVPALADNTASSPTVDTVGNISGYVTTIAVSGTSAYVGANDEYSLKIFDVSTPANPVIQSSYPLTMWSNIVFSGSATSLKINGNYLYLASTYHFTSCCLAGQVDLVDVSDLGAPVRLGRCECGSSILDIEVKGSRAYFTNAWEYFGNSSDLQIVDFSIPSTPTRLSSYTLASDSYSSIALSGTVAYITGNSPGLTMLDVSNPVSPTLLSVFTDVSGTTDIQIVDNLAYVTAGNNGLYIVDLSNPVSPTLISTFDTPGYANSLVVSDTLAYIADEEAGLQIIDVSEPANPLPRGSYDTPGVAYEVQVSGDLIYVADGSEGVQILRLRSLPTTSALIPPTGGVLTASTSATTYIFPSGAFTTSVTISHTDHFPGSFPLTGNLFDIQHTFDVSAISLADGQPLQPASPYTLTVQYTSAERGIVIENTLALYFWDGTQWVREATSALDVAAHTVTATPDHFSLWAILGASNRVFIPLLFR